MSSLNVDHSPSSGSSMFSGPAVRSEATTEAFRRLKVVCVPIMAITSVSPANHSSNLSLLITLRRTLYEFPKDSLEDIFTTPLINYAVFPLTSLLQRNNPLTMPGRLLEEVFTSLAFLVERLKCSEVGLAVKTWEQFWILTSIVLGGPPMVGPKTPVGQDKGKRKELDDELKIACLHLLEALLQPYEGMFGTEEEPSHPSPEHINTLFTSQSLSPILFHTISTLLDLLTPLSPNLPIKLSSIRLLRLIVTTYMRGKNEMLASVMPGAISTMIKVVSGEGGLLKAELGKEICGFVGDVVVGTVGDEEMVKRGVLRNQVTSLDQLAYELVSEGHATDDRVPASQPNDKTTQPFPDLTPQYLAYTQTQILASLRNLIPPLQVHPSSTVREPLGSLAYNLLRQCFRSMPLLQQPLLSTLLLLSRDDFEQVSSTASSALVSLLSEDKVGTELYGQIRTILESSIAAFPQQVMARNDVKVQETTCIITAIGVLTTRLPPRSYSKTNLIRSILGPDGGVQRWGWSLLRCLELGREPEIQVRKHAGQRAWELAQGQLGWNAAAGLIEDSADGSPDIPAHHQAPYPTLHLRYVESKATFLAVSEMFETLGQAAGEDALFTIEHFVQLSRKKRSGPDVAQSASALWVAEKLLIGVGKSADGGSKRTRKIASDVVDMLVMLDDDDEEGGEEELVGEFEASSSLIPVERTRGMDSVSLLLDKHPTRTTTAEQAESRRLHLQIHRQLVAALAMSLMAVSANILGSAFRPLLLRCLYIVLSYLGSPSPFLQRYAHASLVRMAYHSGYASPQNLVMDNVDYVINIVSQRLTYRRLSPLAPMVLISMIRLVGEPIVPLVQDIVDDIFDVLDDFHGYELLCSTLLAVLDTLIKAMTSEAELVSWQPKRSTSSRLQPPPDPLSNFLALGDWYEQRAVRAKSTVEDYLAKAPQKPWKEEGDEGADPDEPPSGTRDEPEIPPTRQQEVCKQILTKAVHFMSHSSAFIRARVLSLFAGGIAVLVIGDRESDLLPVVHRAWPYVLNRLKDKEPFVVTEAAKVVETLAKYVGDFMSKRILDHAWPTMKGLLDTQAKLDERSALVKRNRQVGATADYTVSHRLYIAIIASMQYIIQEVPITDELLWEMIMAFLPFLDATANEQVQKAAVKLYTQMALRDEDAVWLALRGAQGTVGPHITTYLRHPGLDL